MTIPERVRGMQDIFGEYQRYFTFIKKVARHEFRKNGFTRISTPILERLELVTHGVGDETDIVSKELYTFEDKKWRKLVMKPESTAGVMRAYIENMLQEPQPVYLYYIEPHFRYERPQKGRYREFHQIGAEIIGEMDPVLDAKMIYIGKSLLNNVGFKGTFKLKINSLGNKKEREKYIQELIGFFENKKQHLDDTDLVRLTTNPLRILDSKNPDTCQLLPFAPKMTDFLKKDSLDYYNKVKDYLDILGVEYIEDPSLVRWLDYYSHTVWEFVDDSGRSQDSICWGGRYDELAKNIGHKDAIPAVGFAFGAERMIEAMIEANIKLRNKDLIHLYFIQLGEEATKLTLPLNIEARNKGINTLLSLGTPSLKVQLKKAVQLWAKYVAIIGIMEAKMWVCQLKNMDAGTQEEVKLSNLLNVLVDKIGEENLDFYSPTKDFMIVEPKILEKN